MNRTNRTSDFRLSGVKAGVRALPDHRATNIRGGMGHKSAGGCSTAIFLTLLYHRRLPATTRPDRADTGEKGKTEATPPFLPLVRQSGLGVGAGGVTWFGAHPAPPYGGRFRLIYPCGKAVKLTKPGEEDFRGRHRGERSTERLDFHGLHACCSAGMEFWGGIVLRSAT